MRSASRPTIALLLVGCPLALIALTGCDTTQNKAARIKVKSERTLASRKPTKVKQTADDVHATKVTLLGGKDGTAVVLELENTGDEPATDLPVLVGVRDAGGDEEYLNDGKNLAYFKTHTPGIDAGDRAVWVYSSKVPLKEGSTAFAKVGTGNSPPITSAATIPQIDVGEVSQHDEDPAKVEVAVANRIGFPQYDLTVFAWAIRDGRFVAAGRASAGDLEADETEPVTVRLIGDPKEAEIHVSAPPTIYQ